MVPNAVAAAAILLAVFCFQPAVPQEPEVLSDAEDDLTDPKLAEGFSLDPPSIRCFCNLPACLEASGGVQTCTSRVGCFAEALRYDKDMSVTPSPVSTTTRVPIPKVLDDEAAAIAMLDDKALLSMYGCLELMPTPPGANKTCFKTSWKSIEEHSKYPSLPTSSHPPNVIEGGLIRAYHCCKNNMCNDIIHVTADMLAAQADLNDELAQSNQSSVPVDTAVTVTPVAAEPSSVPTSSDTAIPISENVVPGSVAETVQLVYPAGPEPVQFVFAAKGAVENDLETNNAVSTSAAVEIKEKDKDAMPMNVVGSETTTTGMASDNDIDVNGVMSVPAMVAGKNDDVKNVTSMDVAKTKDEVKDAMPMNAVGSEALNATVMASDSDKDLSGVISLPAMVTGTKVDAKDAKPMDLATTKDVAKGAKPMDLAATKDNIKYDMTMDVTCSETVMEENDAMTTVFPETILVKNATVVTEPEIVVSPNSADRVQEVTAEAVIAKVKEDQTMTEGMSIATEAAMMTVTESSMSAITEGTSVTEKDTSSTTQVTSVLKEMTSNSAAEGSISASTEISMLAVTEGTMLTTTEGKSDMTEGTTKTVEGTTTITTTTATTEESHKISTTDRMLAFSGVDVVDNSMDIVIMPEENGTESKDHANLMVTSIMRNTLDNGTKTVTLSAAMIGMNNAIGFFTNQSSDLSDMDTVVSGLEKIANGDKVADVNFTKVNVDYVLSENSVANITPIRPFVGHNFSNDTSVVDDSKTDSGSGSGSGDGAIQGALNFDHQPNSATTATVEVQETFVTATDPSQHVIRKRFDSHYPYASPVYRKMPSGTDAITPISPRDVGLDEQTSAITDDVLKDKEQVDRFLKEITNVHSREDRITAEAERQEFHDTIESLLPSWAVIGFGGAALIAISVGAMWIIMVIRKTTNETTIGVVDNYKGACSNPSVPCACDGWRGRRPPTGHQTEPMDARHSVIPLKPVLPARNKTCHSCKSKNYNDGRNPISPSHQVVALT